MFKNKKEFIDISPIINKKIAVFPGDTEYSRNILLDFKKGHNLLLSSINATMHLGAHTDAPNHYHADGLGIDKRDLNFYFGECQVITVNIPKKARIYPKDIENIKIIAQRILFRTNSFNDPYTWNNDFNALSPELIEYLVKKEVVLVGIDTPSIDPSDSKNLETHNAVYKNNIAVLEGIYLVNTKDTLYNLVCLPLNLEDADASPVRAVLYN
ncbi:MAG: cyclase family protein [Candidatus Sericytochromatia bacterium]